jgi:hypothetical protein
VEKNTLFVVFADHQERRPISRNVLAGHVSQGQIRSSDLDQRTAAITSHHLPGRGHVTIVR